MMSPASLSHYTGKEEKRSIRHSRTETCGTSNPNAPSWVDQVNESLNCEPTDEQNYWEKRSIYKVPARVANLNREAYKPQVVSFGPYHHGKDHLRPMEDHKHRVLLHFFRRFGKPLEDLVETLRGSVGDLKACYDGLDPKWEDGAEGTDRFLQLLITDGCFMLEILRHKPQKVNDYAPNDPIFSEHGKLFIFPVIKRDMLLLENQLPMLVLDQLVDACKEAESANELILKFFSRSLKNASKEKCLHVLDVFRKSMLMEPEKEPEKEEAKSKRRPEKEEAKSKRSKEIIRSATELREHGIRFRKSHTDSLKDISFASGVLRLPRIVVDEATESMFLNLIAFERCHVGAGKEVTSYIFFMDNIIDKGQDVALLHTKGIIRNGMESDEAAAKLFNSLAMGVVLDPKSSLHDVINEVRKYFRKKRHKWSANLKHTYFRNPWVILSLIAAVLLFGLTAIQTAYTVLSYNK
ncbi:hypothetical protein BT93_H3122 [Corymbia citriodora subsp. variegata]|nr:hypothetical protein BT93_H3122 [Corymbia citriodora subsp. variegata]